MEKRRPAALLASVILSIVLVSGQAADYVPAPFFQRQAESSPVLSQESSGAFSFWDGWAAYPQGYKPLSSESAHLYHQIFDLQKRGDLMAADRLIGTLDDKRLMGHVLAARYLHPSYKTSGRELKAWMDRYADHPQADKIYSLAQRRAPGNVAKPKHGDVLAYAPDPTLTKGKVYVSTQERTAGQSQQVQVLAARVKDDLRRGDVDGAVKRFRQSSAYGVMDQVEKDRIVGAIAAAYLYQGKIGEAKEFAVRAAQRSGAMAPKVAWVAGLSYWKSKDYKNAARHFDMVGQSEYSSDWLSAAGHYWAARSYKMAGVYVQAKQSLRHAAEHRYSFYGLIAAHELGRAADFDWSEPQFTSENEKLLLSTAAGRRAMALVAAQQYDLAQEELLRVDYAANEKMELAVLSYAQHIGLSSLSYRLGGRLKDESGRHYDSALYPVASWEPKGGYRLSSALVHAVMRQESKFDVAARSASGAMGLMQLMPKTAQYVAQNNDYAEDVATENAVSDPENNLRLGQDYLEYLLQGDYVQGDLVALAVAYNAGPGNLDKWKKSIGMDDPLLFIETIPVQETRDYVEHVLANYWIYSLRAGQDVPSLTALINGEPVQYALDQDRGFTLRFASR